MKINLLTAVFLISSVMVISLSSCQTEMEVKTYMVQGSTTNLLGVENEVVLAPRPFSVEFWFKSWEIQAADTLLTAYSVFSEKPIDVPTEKLKKSAKEQQLGFEDLPLSEPGSLKANVMKMDRYKGRQVCSFTRCIEEPEMLKLVIKVNTLNKNSLSKYQDVYYNLLICSESEERLFKGKVTFKND